MKHMTLREYQEQDLVLKLRFGFINWFQFFEQWRKLHG